VIVPAASEAQRGLDSNGPATDDEKATHASTALADKDLMRTCVVN
jgi:hypothetical protein